MKLIALSGSLRAGSYNTALLRSAAHLVPAGSEMVMARGLDLLPLYDEDLNTEGYPELVEGFRQQFADADALVLSTPEYNRSFSGVIKNALDWLSRPLSPVSGKPALVIGAGPGALGTALANYHLRQVLSVMNVDVMPGREILVSGARAKFAEDMQLTDEATREFLREGLEGLVQRTRRIRADW